MDDQQGVDLKGWDSPGWHTQCHCGNHAAHKLRIEADTDEENGWRDGELPESHPAAIRDRAIAEAYQFFLTNAEAHAHLYVLMKMGHLIEPYKFFQQTKPTTGETNEHP
jgi:hypothetical protein